ncbi:MAG TPA: efflux RND transporter permease subunit [Streptosporangiaceae bacterium]|nr:efflux RND transporter permease subunit [Streptosporangiaceae bacterium]
MLARLTGLALRRPRAVLLVVLLLVMGAGTLSMGLQDRVTAGGYEDEGSESAKTTGVVEQTFNQRETNLVLVVSDGRGVDNPQVATAAESLRQRLAQEQGVSNVASYWSLGRPAALRGEGGGSALVIGHIAGDFDERIDRAEALRPKYTGTVDGLNVTMGGTALMWQENIKQSQEDVAKAESLVFPLTMLVLVLIFGSLVAALLPLAVAFVALLVGMAVMWGLTFATETSNVVVNITTFLSLGLAIDYSLLIVYRYREELRKGSDIPTAIMGAMRTAGRTVVFSSVTMAIAFTALLVFPHPFLRSIGWSCMATALIAAAGALLVVPAMLAWLGPRVEKGRILRRKQHPGAAAESGFWHRMVTFVMRHPVVASLGVLVGVVLVGSPALGMNLRLPDEQMLPQSAQSAQVAQTVRADFNTRELDTIQVVAQNIGNPQSRSSDIAGYAARLSSMPDVARVDALSGSYADGRQVAPPGPNSARFAASDATYLQVVPAVDGYSEAAKGLVDDIRSGPAPFDVTVGGIPADNADTFKTLYDRMPLALGILAVGMFVLLFLLTGSVVLPIVAMVLSGLSMSATFGAVVYIFQDGHLRWLVGDFITTGAVIWMIPVMIFGIAFGLAMDYQVFMLSRIKEEWDRTKDNTQAVAVGLERTGRVITYAAILISTVFVVWVTSGLNYMKAFAIGIPLAILVDATVIRGLLLPAVMKMLGRGSWWAPKPLRAVHRRFGLSETAGPLPAGAAGSAEGQQVPVEVRK